MTAPPARTEPDIHFREFRQEDLRSCAILAEEAWPYVHDDNAGAHDGSRMEGYVQSSFLWSTWAEVALDPQGVVGFLFGRINEDVRRINEMRTALRELSMMLDMATSKEWTPDRPVYLLWCLFLTEFKLAVNRPRSDAEIEMLIVGSKSRGKGIGQLLADRFVAAARKKGAKTVTLYTDDTSNWQFYERYGFKKVAAFHDNTTSYFAGRDSTGMVYALDLRRRDNCEELP